MAKPAYSNKRNTEINSQHMHTRVAELHSPVTHKNQLRQKEKKDPSHRIPTTAQNHSNSMPHKQHKTKKRQIRNRFMKNGAQKDAPHIEVVMSHTARGEDDFQPRTGRHTTERQKYLKGRLTYITSDYQVRIRKINSKIVQKSKPKNKIERVPRCKRSTARNIEKIIRKAFKRAHADKCSNLSPRRQERSQQLNTLTKMFAKVSCCDK